MNLPPTSANERRAVPRHMRDGEHHEWDEAAAVSGRDSWRRPATWVLLAVLAVLAVAWTWLARA